MYTLNYLHTLLFVETAMQLIKHLMGVTLNPVKLIFHWDSDVMQGIVGVWQ